MKAHDVVELLQWLEANGIPVWVDGGWGVDALLGEQTRPHSDLDIALRHRDVPRLREVLAARGYREVLRDDTRDCNFVLEDGESRQVDVHSFTFDEAGNNIYGVAYAPEHLTGSGVIDGCPVRCIPADVMVGFHTGYALDENDFHDVLALCWRFNIALPAEYVTFTNNPLMKGSDA